VFLLLVIVQTMHSIEEYATELYLNLAPARYISGLISANPELGFVIFNALIVAFGFWCYFVPVRAGYRTARALAWGWTIVEVANGTAHIMLAATAGGYFSGVATAPLLIIAAAFLAASLKSDR
jgi:hypothetical protein